MNIRKIRQYISEYKRRFDDINEMEIYKWQAVRKFQTIFDIEAPRFAEMLTESLSKTYNLMDTGNYFPRKMIISNAQKTPEKVRSLFRDLYGQETDRISRIKKFQSDIREINKANFGEQGLKDYQDHRAIIVYLNLRYPNDNFFYKFRMFKDLIAKIEYEYTPKIGALSNITQFYTICEIIKDLLLQDNTVIRLHKSRIGKDEYFDTEFNILTQDFIYAVTNHLRSFTMKANKNAINLINSQIEMQNESGVHLQGSIIDHIKSQKRNKIIGDLGELLILRFEKKHCPKKFMKFVSHDSKNIGDGLGYDILSYDDLGHEKYIEVKTTKGDLSVPFFITRNELEKSLLEKNSYYLYRLFNFNVDANTADLKIISGELSKYCSCPTQYRVSIDKRKLP